jgi:hypothetical protein
LLLFSFINTEFITIISLTTKAPTILYIGDNLERDAGKKVNKRK